MAREKKQSPFVIKPRKGLLVRDPVNGQPLAEQGEEKSRSTYWMRRLIDGDVVEVGSTGSEGKQPKGQE